MTTIKSVEEKARAYDEAIEKGKQIQNTPYTAHWDIMKEVAEHLLPELKEFEDERMRKVAIEACKYMVDNFENSTRQYEDAIAWLEKQGEHANFLSKIQIGDKVTRNEDGVLVNLSQLNRVTKKQTEQKLYVNDNAKEMFIKALERVEEQNNKGYKLTDCDKNSWWEDFKAYTSCIIEQKPAWSEEDSPYYDDICEMLINLLYSETANVNKGAVQKDLDWLISLRPQNTWKPSDEQMITLRHVISGCSYDIEPLVELETKLKEL